jgi:hypothetical protein
MRTRSGTKYNVWPPNSWDAYGQDATDSRGWNAIRDVYKIASGETLNTYHRRRNPVPALNDLCRSTWRLLSAFARSPPHSPFPSHRRTVVFSHVFPVFLSELVGVLTLSDSAIITAYRLLIVCCYEPGATSAVSTKAMRSIAFTQAIQQALTSEFENDLNAACFADGHCV